MTRSRSHKVAWRGRLAGRRRTPRLYDDLASWWPILSDPADYAVEASRHRKVLVAACARRPRTLLELGSGGGNNAFHMKRHFRATTLVDRSEGMLAVSRRLNPDCEHVLGDMRRVRLGRTFDAVFVHDAIGYMTSEKDLAAAIATAYGHCAPGGAVLFVPDYVRETFKPSTQHGGHDGGQRALRYLMWAWDPDPKDTTYLLDFAYLLRLPDGTMICEPDRHEIGLFPKSTWRRLLAAAGFRVRTLIDPEPDLEPSARIVFAGQKPPR
jgi:SAM-dependent methyltransferase